jgi:type VII secretion protein EccB
MSRTAATTSQVRAYRFMLRRMESALVGRDAVMRREPMRQHLRATAVGLVLSVLGLAAFFVVGRFRPVSDLNPDDIVIARPSQAVFVVRDNPRRLVPVPNLTSARLLLLALAPGQQQPAVKTVEEAALAGIPRTQVTGIPAAPPLPSAENLIHPVWSVCDTAPTQGAFPQAPTANPVVTQPTTAVLIQQRPPAARGVGEEAALLVAEQRTRVTYLVWRGRRGRIDLADPAIRTLYRLGNVAPRPVSSGLLNAIPEGHPLVLPAIPVGRPVPQLPGLQVGDVVRVQGAQDSFFLLLPQGVQPIEPAVADLIRYHHSTSPEVPTVTPEALARVPEAPLAAQLDFAGFPHRVPKVLGAADIPVACLTWLGPDQAALITVGPDGRLPIAAGESPVELPSSGDGRTADAVYLTPTKAALVHDVQPGQRPDASTLWLVTDQGFRYLVPSAQVAAALGLGVASTPAPAPILELLPVGPALDPQRAVTAINGN